MFLSPLQLHMIIKVAQRKHRDNKHHSKHYFVIGSRENWSGLAANSVRVAPTRCIRLNRHEVFQVNNRDEWFMLNYSSLPKTRSLFSIFLRFVLAQLTLF